MKFLISFILLASFHSADAQGYRRLTTTLLSKELISSNTRHITENEISWALPLIDSAMGMLLVMNSPGIDCDPANLSNNLLTALVSMKVKDDLLKEKLNNDLQGYRCRCSDTVKREAFPIDEYPEAYMIDGGTLSGLYHQYNQKDTNFFRIARSEFEFWAPYAMKFMDAVARPLFKQKEDRSKIDPCAIAGFHNASAWMNYLFHVAEMKSYSSKDPKVNEVFSKMTRGKFKATELPSFREPFRRLSEGGVQLSREYETLEQLDFEKESALKSLMDEVRGKEDWTIRIYTNGSKGLFYRSFLTPIPSSGDYAKFEQAFLLELSGPSEIRLTRIRLMERSL